MRQEQLVLGRKFIMQDSIPVLAQKYCFPGTSQDYYRFLLHFDVHAAICVAQGRELRDALKEAEGVTLWEKSWNADCFKEELLKTHRKYFYFSLQHKPINVFYTAFCGAVHTQLLCFLVKGVPSDRWEDMLGQWTRRFPVSWFGGNCGSIQSEYLCEFHKMNEAVDPSDLNQLRQSLSSIEITAERMECAFENLKKQDGGQLRERRKTRIQAGGSSPFGALTNPQKIRLICFLECSEETQAEPGKQWLAVLRAKWGEFFPESPLGREEERWLSRVLVLRLPGQLERSRPEGKSELSKYCRAMGAAIDHGGVKNLESAVYLNSILLMRAVLMTMAYANLDKLAFRTEDTILADVLSYLENVTYMASDEENSIILEYIRLFRPNGMIDRECVLFAQRYRSVLGKNFSAICKAMEKKNRNIRQVTNLSDRLKEMEGSLRNADFSVKRDIVLGLDRGSYGHRLGELYRFWEGLDKRDVEQVRELLGCIFQLLDTLGITPASQERLDEFIDEDDELYGRIIPEGNLTKEGARILRYPGWSVYGVQVVPPVYSIKQGGDEK